VHQLDPSLEEASINLGVSPAATFASLTVPLMASGLVGGLVLVWITAASELSATVVLYSSRWATTTVVMYHAIEGTGAGLAAAAAAVLILVTAIPLLLINRRVNKQEATVI
jgi:iron(III) transport system permease protein